MRASFGPVISAAALTLCSILALMWSRSYERSNYLSY